MNVAIRQAITTELTIGGFARTGSRGNGSDITEIPWNHFYNMVLSTAKMLDNSKSKQTGRPQEANRSSTRRNVNNANNSAKTPKPFTKYTGPSMVMQDGMKFSNADWKKLSKEQKSKLYELKKKRTVVAVNNTNVETPAEPTPTPVTTAPSPSPATTCDVRHLLSNSTSRESTPASQIVVNGRTYTLNFCSRTYSINNEIRTNKGALLMVGQMED
jgi:hypothetical protein